MPAALALVKRDLGADAVILGTRTIEPHGVGRLLGRGVVEITASPGVSGVGRGSSADVRGERPAEIRVGRASRPSMSVEPVGSAVRTTGRDTASDARTAGVVNGPRCGPYGLPNHGLSNDLLPYYTRLVQHELAAELAAELVQRAARSGGDAEALERELREYIAGLIPTSGGITLTGTQARRVLFVGPPGAGKTTSVAKLAAHFALRQKKRVAVVSLDMHRLGAHEQLRRYAEIIGVAFHAAQSGAEVRELFAKLKDVDLILIDTPGVGRRDDARFARLAAMMRAAKADEIHLVLPAGMSEAVQSRTAAAFAPLGVSRVVLTRLDDALGLGVITNTVAKLNWRLSYVCNGQNVPRDIEEACGRRLAAVVFPAN